jgi:hypothetical protein
MMSKRAASTTTPLREIVVSKPGTRSYSPAAAQDDDSGSMITEDQGCESNVTSDGEEMDSIATFIENVEVAVRDSEESSEDFSTPDVPLEVSENVQPKNPSRSNTGRILRSRAGVSSPEEHHESIMSPFHTVRGKGDYDSRLQKLRDSNVQPENNKSVRHHVRFADRESRNVIQDMIDLSLSQKKINSSEKVLRTAFIEFYRGLGLLKSYRFALSNLKPPYV